MYFAYIDESGDPGFVRRDRSGTEAYTLSVLLVKDSEWLESLNRLIGFRRRLRDNYGIRMNDELKATHFIHNNGPFARLNLGDDIRMDIYRRCLSVQRKIGLFTAWAVVFDKPEWEARYPGWDIFKTSWQNMLERLERFTSREGEYCAIFPDEGSNEKIRAVTRQIRRFGRPQSAYNQYRLERDARLILEDPSPRASQDSYFIQFADFNAYAATRATFPKPWCNETYWEELGDTRDQLVNWIARRRDPQRYGIRGIALKP